MYMPLEVVLISEYLFVYKTSRFINLSGHWQSLHRDNKKTKKEQLHVIASEKKINT